MGMKEIEESLLITIAKKRMDVLGLVRNVLSMTTMKFSEKTETMATMNVSGGFQILANEKFVNKNKENWSMLEAIMLHEIMHIVLGHMFIIKVPFIKGNGYEHNDVNIAADMEANAIIQNMKIFDAENLFFLYSLLPNEYNGESWVDFLSTSKMKDVQVFGDHSMMPFNGGDVPDISNNKKEEIVANGYNLRNENKGTIIDIVHDAKAVAIRIALDLTIKKNVSYKKEHLLVTSKVLPKKTKLPTEKRVDPGFTIFAIDTSGSMDKNKLSKVLPVFKEVSKKIKRFKVAMMDDKLLYLDEKFPTKIWGGGGTNFTSSFREFEKIGVKNLITYTDGEFEQFYTRICNLYWIIVSNKRIKMKGVQYNV